MSLPGRGGEGIERDRHSHVQTETIAEPMQQGADALFRSRILPSDSRMRLMFHERCSLLNRSRIKIVYTNSHELAAI